MKPQISTHTPLAERDLNPVQEVGAAVTFLLTRPSRSVTKTEQKFQRFCGFLLTRPSRSVTDTTGEMTVSCTISTHTPLAERDIIERDTRAAVEISTHTPLAERDECRESIDDRS